MEQKKSALIMTLAMLVALFVILQITHVNASPAYTYISSGIVISISDGVLQILDTENGKIIDLSEKNTSILKSLNIDRYYSQLKRNIKLFLL